MNSPPMPLIRNIQPRKMVIARLARGGTIIAAIPRMASRMPSNRKAFQCAFTAALILDCSWLKSWGRVMADLPASLPRPILAPTRGRRKALGRGAHPVSPEIIDRGRDNQQRGAEHDRGKPDRHQHQCDVVIGV